MNYYVCNESRLATLWNSCGNKRYIIKNLVTNNTWVTKIIFQDKHKDCKVVGKIVTPFSELEILHWPRLQHRSLAPLLDIVYLDVNLSIFISVYAEKNLREIVHEESFLSDPHCFNRKKIFVEDVLWGLDYLHKRSLVLMNLSDANIYICDQSNQAIITDFSCLRSFCQAKKQKFAVPSFYRAPELNKCNDLFEKCEMFNPVAAEMWAVGVMVLEIFFQHKVPWALIDYDSNRSAEIIDYIDYDILKMANRGSPLSEMDLSDFKTFVKLFFALNPHERCDAKKAASTPFLQSKLNIPMTLPKSLWQELSECSGQNLHSYNIFESNDLTKQKHSFNCTASQCKMTSEWTGQQSKGFHDQIDFHSCLSAKKSRELLPITNSHSVNETPKQEEEIESQAGFQNLRKVHSTGNSNQEISLFKEPFYDDLLKEIPENGFHCKKTNFSRSLHSISKQNMGYETKKAIISNQRKCMISCDLHYSKENHGSNNGSVNEKQERRSNEFQNFENNDQDSNNACDKKKFCWRNSKEIKNDNDENNLFLHEQKRSPKSKSMVFFNPKKTSCQRSNSTSDFGRKKPFSNLIKSGMRKRRWDSMAHNSAPSLGNCKNMSKIKESGLSTSILNMFRKNSITDDKNSDQEHNQNQISSYSKRSTEVEKIQQSIMDQNESILNETNTCGQNQPFELERTWRKLPQSNAISTVNSRCIFRNRLNCPVHRDIEPFHTCQHQKSRKSESLNRDNVELSSNSMNIDPSNLNEQTKRMHKPGPLSCCYYSEVTKKDAPNPENVRLQCDEDIVPSEERRKNFSRSRKHSYKRAIFGDKFNDDVLTDGASVNGYKIGKLQSVEKMRKKARKRCFIKIEVVSQKFCEPPKKNKNDTEAPVKKEKNEKALKRFAKFRKTRAQQELSDIKHEISKESSSNEINVSQHTLTAKRSLTLVNPESVDDVETSEKENDSNRRSLKQAALHLLCLGNQ
ncbi:protein kinase domain-containing protein [Trichonephila clavata]|uniref:Protein kinase domain-containing protein n=1 Tax=Trichonephila clavata TaxID=2740835 RepID=A0A8X6H1D8_TRICU|nr:protein kinase domain-containing protein [Trichonephila clavata]